MDDKLLRVRWAEVARVSEDELLSLPSEATYRFDPLDALMDSESLASSQGSEGSLELPTAKPTTSFRLLEEIGHGGMGTVYRAWQSDLDREVALKTLRQERNASWQARRNFLAEAVAVGRLEHPNIVPVYALQADAQGGVSLAMKLVGGESWIKKLRRDRPWRDLSGNALAVHLEILLQVGNALAFAHSRQLVHNDIKPANVMIGDFGEVVVLDWGLAVDIAEDRERRERLHHRSTVQRPCGTPAYMPPELARGDGACIGVWTDVFLLGSTLFEILTGRPPHRGGLLDSARQALQPVEPEFPEHVPEELAAICATAMRFEPAARHASVAAFQEQLRTFLRHRESLRITRGAVAQLGECRERAETLAGLTRHEMLELYEGFSSSVAGFRQAQQLWQDNPRAARGEVEARSAYAHSALRLGDLQLAETQAAFLEEHPESGSLATRETLREALDAARARKRSAERTRKRLRVWLVGALGAVLLSLVAGLALLWVHTRTVEQNHQQIAAKNREIEAAMAEIRRQKSAADTRGEIAQDALNALAREVKLQLIEEHGDARAHQVARAVLETALQGWERLRDAHLGEAAVSLGAARARFEVAELVRTVERDLPRAQSELQSAVATLRSLDPARPEVAAELSLSLSILAVVRGQLGDIEASVADAREAVLLQRSLAEQGDRSARDALAARITLLGDALDGGGDPEGAREAYYESLAIRRQLLAEEPSQTVERHMSASLLRVGGMHRDSGEYDQARAAFEELLAIEWAALAEQPDNARHKRVASIAVSELAEVAAAQGFIDDARDLYAQCLQMTRELFVLHPESVQAQDDLDTVLYFFGRLLWQAERPAEALPIFEELLALRRRLAVFRDDSQNRPALASALRWVGRLYGKLGDGPRSFEHYLDLLAVLRAAAEDGGEEERRQLALGLAEAGKMAEIVEDLARAESFYGEGLLLLAEVLESRPEDDEALRFQALMRTWLADVARGALARQEELYSQAYADCRRRLEERPEDRDALWDLTQSGRQLAGVRLSQGRAQEALQLASEATAGVRVLWQDDPTRAASLDELVLTLQLEADALVALGRPEEAADPLEEGLRLASEQADAYPENEFKQRALLAVLSRIGLLCRRAEKWQLAVQYGSQELRRARAVARRFPSYDNRRSLGLALRSLASAQTATGGLPEAQELLGEAREILAELVAERPEDPVLLEDRAFLLLELGQWAAAAGSQPDQLWLEADAALAALLEARPGDVGLLQHRLAALERLGRGYESRAAWDEALAVFAEAFRLAQALAAAGDGEDSQRALPVAHMDLARVQEARGELAEALRHVSSALAAHEGVRDPSARALEERKMMRTELRRLRARLED